MNKLLAAALALSAITCQQKEDTVAPQTWPRSFQPRLSVATEWQRCTPKPLTGERVVQDFLCGAPHNPSPPVSSRGEACDDMNETTHTEALRILSSPSPCYAKAIRNLKRLAVEDPRALSDLSAAYYLRAQRTDEPADLLPAMQYALEAVDKTPRSFVARFNLALCQEALGMDEDAIQSWDLVRAANHGSWSVEAAEHREALVAKGENAAAVQWPRAKAQWSAGALAEQFPAAAQRYVEEELLPQWDLARARAIAEALWKRNDDRFLLDVVEAAEKSGGELRKAHQEFAEGRAIAGNLKYDQAPRFASAAAGFRGRSPMELRAQTEVAIALVQEMKEQDSVALLDTIIATAERRHYASLAAHARHQRALALLYLSRLTAALQDYDAAARAYAALRDHDGFSVECSSRGAVHRVMGNDRLAWRDMLLAWQYAPHVIETSRRHLLLGEIAATAAALDSPSVARRYQQVAVDLIRRSLVNTPPDRTDDIAGLQSELAIALSWQASYESALGNRAAAERALEEAGYLMRDADEGIAEAILPRTYESRGQVALQTDPAAAVQAFTEAIEYAENSEYQTYRALLYAQRAEARRRAGDSAGVEEDLGAAIRELQSEEKQMLARREVGHAENLWGAYFSRFSDVYDQLIDVYIQTDRKEKAFALAERARAFEPLELILRRRHTLPEAFEQLARKPVNLREIQKALPKNVHLVQYRVQKERTYVWTISSTGMHVHTLAIGKEAIGKWAEKLSAVDSTYDATAAAVYDALVAKALDVIPPAADRRLVFVPDGPLHAISIAALRRDGRYLVESETIASAGSARLYLWAVERDRRLTVPPSILLIANPTRHLEHSLREVERIAPLYERKKILREAEATVAAFFDEAPNYSIVHIAAHAAADAQAPFQSYIELSERDLEAQELLAELDADNTRLFILSACSGTGGSPVGPEGVAPLVRPLIAAGVPAVVGSLRRVGDDAAEAVMVRFHTHWRQGHDAAEALRRAQLDLLRGNVAGKPVHVWGSFQVIGHATSPFASPPRIKNKEK